MTVDGSVLKGFQVFILMGSQTFAAHSGYILPYNVKTHP